MQLSKDEKELLKVWRSHPGYVVFNKLVDDRLARLTETLMKDVDLENPSHLKTLRDNQIYMRALRDCVNTIETNTNGIYSPKSS